MKIEKEKSELGCYDINFVTEDKMFTIFYGGNGDLYWQLLSQDISDDNTYSFDISKDNNEIYEIFSKLYSNIENCKVFEEDNQFWKNLEKSDAYELLFKDKIITWHSDDTIFEDANTFSIIKEEDKFQIQFLFKNKDFLEDAVRIRNSGSRYEPFNIVFMDMFKQLQEYDINKKTQSKNSYVKKK